MRSRVVAAIAIATLAASGMASAHHSISTIDISTPVWVKGTVVRYRPGSPHALLELQAQAADGRQERWLMEGPFPGRMARIIALYGGSLEAYLKPGDVVEICGFRPTSSYSVQRSYSEVTIDPAHFIHAQLLLMPDGQMRVWGPYGKLDNCVRARDTTQAWQQFLNRDALARELWCSGLRYTRAPSVAPRTFVEDVNRGLAAPCR
jgi:Family of unknown function (DUF6152)